MSEFEKRYAALRERFMHSLPERLEAICSALRKRDLVMARRHVHNLKGTADSLEATELAAKMRTIETRLDAALAGDALREDEWSALEAQCKSESIR